MRCIDQIPSVTTCCFCCYLRSGCVLIAVFSFTAGVVLAPSISYVHSKPPSVLPEPLTSTERGIQVMLGLVSILLCISSGILCIGSICSVPILIELYQWGALIYCSITTVLYSILACYCLFVHATYTAGGWLVGIAFLDVFVTSYFLLVANSLRMSLIFRRTIDALY